MKEKKNAKDFVKEILIEQNKLIKISKWNKIKLKLIKTKD